MTRSWLHFLFVVLTLLALSPAARASGYTQRLSLGAGVEKPEGSSQTDFMLSLEYEYRFAPAFGAGVLGDYVFADPGFAVVGVPVFLHPFETDFLLMAAPIVRFGSGISTQTGVRLGTRAPIPLSGSFTLIPSFAVDFIGGGHDLIFGLGFEF